MPLCIFCGNGNFACAGFYHFPCRDNYYIIHGFALMSDIHKETPVPCFFNNSSTALPSALYILL